MAWSGSFGFVGLVCAPWDSSDASGIVGFVRVRPWVVDFILAHPDGHRAHSGSLGSFRRTLVVIVFIQVRSVHFSAPWRTSGSFAIVLAHTGARRVHLHCLGAFGPTLGVVGFIRVRWVYSCSRRVHLGASGSLERALGVVAFIRVHWVHFDASRAWSVSFRFVEVIPTRPCPF